jgi:hypothetical protein
MDVDHRNRKSTTAARAPHCDGISEYVHALKGTGFSPSDTAEK